MDFKIVLISGMSSGCFKNFGKAMDVWERFMYVSICSISQGRLNRGNSH